LTDDAYKEQGEKNATPPSGTHLASAPLTRRGFVAGALGAGAAALAAGSAAALSACSTGDEKELTNLASQDVSDEDIETLHVGVDQVVKAADLEEAPFGDYLKEQASYELPFGSLFSPIDSSSALVLSPGAQGEAFRKIGVLDLTSGDVLILVDKPVGDARGMVIYDARATRTALIWVEVDLGTLTWQVYIALLAGVGVGTARLIEEGTADYDPPMLAIASEKAYWTVMPNAAGAANLEDSLLRALKLGSGVDFQQESPYTVLVSHGRMITNPLVSDGVITFVPRVDTTNVYYQLTALDCASDKPVDFTVMPQSLRVSDALYLDEGFSFCIENNYDYAEGIATFGTYYRLADGSYLQVTKTPMSAPVRFKDCLIVKSIYNIIGIDLAQMKTFIIPAPTDSSGFGEALVGWGTQEKVVTCSLRMNRDSEQIGTLIVRVFS
jgi:hypothetical protein